MIDGIESITNDVYFMRSYSISIFLEYFIKNIVSKQKQSTIISDMYSL